MKDLIAGSLGRLDDAGGSSMFAVPRTIYVPPEYEVETDVPSVAEFVTCSLDGRLWVFRRSRRYYVAALRFNELTQRLVFGSTTALNNPTLIGRGVDMFLTDNAIVQASNNTPYVNTANLFSDSQVKLFYSALRSKDVTSAWGASEDTGNSDGHGYFNRSAILQSVSKHYSLLPAIGDWHIIKNFLVRNPNNALTNSHNSMLNIRPLIPLEFHGSNSFYGCGFDNDIFLTYFNGELWGRGRYNIGKCYILPAVFDETGNPQEFYLYISPDYKKTNAVTQVDWYNLGIFKTSDNVYGFLTSQDDNLDNGFCFKPDSLKIFDISNDEWQEISQSGLMFIDTCNHSGLVMQNDNVIFLNGASYECKGLSQWLAPANVFDAVTDYSVVSSFDNSVIATHYQQSFYREILIAKKLPISVSAYSGKKFSSGVTDAGNVKSIQVNSITEINNTETITWQNVYKQSVNLKKLNSFSKNFENTISPYPIFIEVGLRGEPLFTLPGIKPDQNIYDWWDFHYGYWGYHEYRGVELPLWPSTGYSAGTNSVGDWVYGFDGYAHNSRQKIFYIHPESGEPVSLTLSWDDGNENQVLTNSLQDRLDFISNHSEYDVPSDIVVQNGQIGYSYYSYSGDNYERRFQPISSSPSEISNWQKNSLGKLPLQSILIPKNIPQNVTCSASAVFSEKKTKSKFLCDIPSAFKSANGIISGNLANVDNPIWNYYDYWNVNSLDEDNLFSTQGLHVAVAYVDADVEKLFFVFKSELHPEIFDFNAELERSKLS